MCRGLISLLKHLTHIDIRIFKESMNKIVLLDNLSNILPNYFDDGTYIVFEFPNQNELYLILICIGS